MANTQIEPAQQRHKKISLFPLGTACLQKRWRTYCEVSPPPYLATGNVCFLSTILRSKSSTPIIEYGSQVLCLKTTVLRGQLSGAEGRQAEASVFRESENVLLVDDASQQFLPGADKKNAKIEEPETSRDGTVAIWVTWPVNDTVLPVGDVVLVFETRGFPPGEIPIEVSAAEAGPQKVYVNRLRGFCPAGDYSLCAMQCST